MYAPPGEHRHAMLTYVNSGERRYGDQAVRPYLRPDWEFLAVLDGRVAPVIPGQRPQLRARTLWVLPPEHAHGWTGDERPARIIVAHAPAVPEPLRHALEHAPGRPGFLAAPLDDAQCEELAAAIAGERAPGSAGDPLIALRQESLALRLALLVLRQVPTPRLPSVPQDARRSAVLALAWLREHLADGGSVEGAAKATGISTAHLRRLMHQALGRSPRETLRRLRIDRADELMRDHTVTLERIAADCGFSDAAALSRAYRAVRGHPPRRPGRPST